MHAKVSVHCGLSTGKDDMSDRSSCHSEHLVSTEEHLMMV